MSDIVTPEKRSQMMAGIKGRNTNPELLVRSLLHKAGFRFKLHDKSLPGKPDLVFPKYKALILIHGCFWHGHHCSLFKLPSTNKEFWNNKISGTIARDKKNFIKLCNLDWKILIIWECALRGKNKLPKERLFQLCKLWIEEREENFEIKGT